MNCYVLYVKYVGEDVEIWDVYMSEQDGIRAMQDYLNEVKHVKIFGDVEQWYRTDILDRKGDACPSLVWRFRDSAGLMLLDLILTRRELRGSPLTALAEQADE